MAKRQFTMADARRIVRESRLAAPPGGLEPAKKQNGKSVFSPQWGIATIPPRYDPKAPVPPDAGSDEGISGTLNWSGKIYSETNTNLQWQLAYGFPGQFTWGAWETLIRTDDACAATLAVTLAPLRDADLHVEPADDSPEQATMAEFVEDNLLKWLEPKWGTFIEQSCGGALTYGFALHEKVFGVRPDDRVPGGTAVYLKKLAERLPSSVHTNGWFDDPATHDLAWIKQIGQKDGRWLPEVMLPSSKVLLHTWNRNGNNYQGFSAFRPVWYLVQIRAQLAKIIAVGMQRESCGIPVAQLEKGVRLDGEQLTRLQKFVETIIYHENAGAVIPGGVKLDWIFSKGADKSHVIETWEKLGQAIHMQLQAQQMGLGVNGTGSRAVGAVHNAKQNQFVLGVKASFEAVCNGVGERPYTGLVRSIIVPNFGEQKAYPQVTLQIKQSELSTADWADAFQKIAMAGGITITTDVENEARERLGIETLTDDERDQAIQKKTQQDVAKVQALKPAEPAVGADGAKPSATGSQPGRSAPAAADGPTQQGGLAPRRVGFAAVALSDKPFVAWRPLTPNEQVVHFAEINSFLNNARDKFANTVRPLVGEMVIKAMPEVRAAMAARDPRAIFNIKLDNARLAKAIDTFLGEARAEGYKQVQNEYRGQKDAVLAKRAAGNQEMAPAPKRLADPPDGDDVEAQVQALFEAERDRLLQYMTARTLNDLEQQAIEMARTGGDPDDIVQQVIGDMLDDPNMFKADASTVLTRAFNMGREDFADEHADEVDTVELSALLDGNNCDPCAELDGEEYEYGSDEHEEHVPPLTNICDGEDRCRCILIYNFKGQPGAADDGGDEEEDDNGDEA